MNQCGLGRIVDFRQKDVQDSTALGKVGTRRDVRRYKKVYQLVLKVYQRSDQMLPSTPD